MPKVKPSPKKKVTPARSKSTSTSSSKSSPKRSTSSTASSSKTTRTASTKSPPTKKSTKSSTRSAAPKVVSKKPARTKTNSSSAPVSPPPTEELNHTPALSSSTAALTKTTPSPKSSTVLLAYGVSPYQLSPDEAYMTRDQLDHFRHILQNWKRTLMEGVDTAIRDISSVELSADPSDQATQEEVFSLQVRTRDRERKLIKKIDEALERVRLGEYGYCEECGSDIGIGRLEARPTATLCIDCKTVDEIREKRR